MMKILLECALGALLAAIRLYRWVVSPALSVAFGAHCRYSESCSRYAERMLLERGIVRGLALSAKRFLSCNPLSSGCSSNEVAYGK